MADDIDPEVRRFLDEHIRSVAQLELLLLLRTTPERSWTAADLARELRVEAAWAQAQLEGFSQAGLVGITPGESPSYRFAPSTPAQQEAMASVARDYLLHRVRMTERIYGRPSDRIRAFADAFRLKKEPPNG